MKRDPREVLGAKPNASIERCKKLYRKLAMQYHPDRNPGDAVAEERFKEVQDAWERLNGKDSATQLLDSHAVANLCNLFIKCVSDVMQKGGKPIERDLKQMMRDHLNTHASDVSKRLGEIHKQLTALRSMLGKWKAGDDETPLEQVLQSKIADGEGMLQAAEKEKGMVEASSKLLDTWSYKHDEQPIQKSPYWGRTATMTWTA